MPDYRYYEPPELLFARPPRPAKGAAPNAAVATPAEDRAVAARPERPPAAGLPDIEPRPIRVVLADDHCAVREGIARLLGTRHLQQEAARENDSDPWEIQVVGQGDNSNAALTLAQRHRPDVVIMDLSMPGDWQTTMQAIRRDCPGTHILALTMHEDMAYVRTVFHSGGIGYVLKRSAADRLLQAVATVSTGERYIDPALSSQLTSSLLSDGGAAKKSGDDTAAAAPAAGVLSKREEEILRLVARGFTNKEIAARVFLGVKTVETYKARGIQKLGFTSRAEVTRYALRNGWLSD